MPLLIPPLPHRMGNLKGVAPVRQPEETVRALRNLAGYHWASMGQSATIHTAEGSKTHAEAGWFGRFCQQSQGQETGDDVYETTIGDGVASASKKANREKVGE